MARVGLWALALLLAMPTAGAWEASFVSRPSAVSLAESLLLAGSVNATAPEGGYFGAPFGATGLLFDGLVDVVYCPDQAGEPRADTQCPQNEPMTGVAAFYIHGGGIVAFAPNAPIELTARATAAALGGPNVTLNERDLGPGLYVGGDAVVKASGNSLILRPLLGNASIELRGDQGFRTYNGTEYTLLVTGDFNETTLESRGAFVAGPSLDVRVSRAGLALAERELVVDDLFATLRALQPPERADRRAAVAGSFGLFQLVPALLDGAAAARTNLTLNGEERGVFTFVRLEDGRFSHADGNWTGTGNANYMIDDEVVAPRPGASVRFPIVIPAVMIAAAIGARALTYRDPLKPRGRYVAHGIRLGGVGLLALLAASTLTPVLGFSPLLDAPSLALRSRVQLALLVFGMVASAYLAVGLPSESLARSLLAWRDRPRAIVVPAVVGLLATMLFVLFATHILLSFVARFVRL